MRRFSYRLERVLQYRRFVEKRAMLQLAKLKQGYRAIEMQIGQLNMKRLQVAEQCRREGLQGVDVIHYETFQSYLQKLKLELDEASVELAEKEAAIHNQESVLKSETIKRKALETHKESRLKAHRQQAEQEEQKLLDELVIRRQEVRV
jgi:flagellar export protein FliJ